MTKVTGVLATAALFSMLAFGQRPGGGTPPTSEQRIEMRVSRLATLLNLTSDQRAKATTIFTEANAASTNARTSSQTARESLSAAIKSNDTAAIDRHATTLGTLSGQLIAIDSKADAAFYALLTADQKAKYDSMPRGGFGGPGRGPGPGRFNDR